MDEALAHKERLREADRMDFRAAVRGTSRAHPLSRTARAEADRFERLCSLTTVLGADLRHARIVNFSVAILEVRAFGEDAVRRAQEELLSVVEAAAVYQGDNRDEPAAEHLEIAVQGAQRTVERRSAAVRPAQRQTVIAVVELGMGYGDRPIPFVAGSGRGAGHERGGQHRAHHELRFHRVGPFRLETSVARRSFAPLYSTTRLANGFGIDITR